MNTFALGAFTTEEIQTELDRNLEIIALHRGLKPPQPAEYWTAVASRQQLKRELVVRQNTNAIAAGGE